MIEDLPVIQPPHWLESLDAASVRHSQLPLDEILRDSLYYPSCGFDGDPVRFLAGNVLSFIYVDYGMDRQQLEHALATRGFRGYEVIAKRDLDESELAPRGWKSTSIFDTHLDAHRYRQWMKPSFCQWRVFGRCAQMPASHGPKRFSLIYFCADGVAAFDALYVANHAAPAYVAVIQPGHGFGEPVLNFVFEA
jgi:hypothetical protein